VSTVASLSFSQDRSVDRRRVMSSSPSNRIYRLFSGMLHSSPPWSSVIIKANPSLVFFEVTMAFLRPPWYSIEFHLRWFRTATNEKWNSFARLFIHYQQCSDARFSLHFVFLGFHESEVDFHLQFSLDPSSLEYTITYLDQTQLHLECCSWMPW